MTRNRSNLSDGAVRLFPSFRCGTQPRQANRALCTQPESRALAPHEVFTQLLTDCTVFTALVLVTRSAHLSNFDACCELTYSPAGIIQVFPELVCIGMWHLFGKLLPQDTHHHFKHITLKSLSMKIQRDTSSPPPFNKHRIPLLVRAGAMSLSLQLPVSPGMNKMDCCLYLS